MATANQQSGHPGQKNRSKLTIAAVLLMLLSVVGAAVSWAAFTATDTNSSNTWTVGTLQFQDTTTAGGTASGALSGTTLFPSSSTYLVPGSSTYGDAQACIAVSYVGTVDSTLSFSLTDGGGADTLGDSKLDIWIQAGSSTTHTPGTPISCSSFTADGTNPNVVGTSATSTTLASAVSGGPYSLTSVNDAEASTWVPNDYVAYEITVTPTGAVTQANEGELDTAQFVWTATSI